MKPATIILRKLTPDQTASNTGQRQSLPNGWLVRILIRTQPTEAAK